MYWIIVIFEEAKNFKNWDISRMGKILVSSCRARRTGPHSAKKILNRTFPLLSGNDGTSADIRLKTPSTRQNPTFCAQKSKNCAPNMKFHDFFGIFESLFSRFLDFYFLPSAALLSHPGYHKYVDLVPSKSQGEYPY